MPPIMLSLVGEQPIPNLLPIRHDRPQQVVFAYTDLTARVFARLKKLLEPEVQVHPLRVPPYDIPAFQQQLHEFIVQQNWSPLALVFNLTGGTKSMGFAAYELARSLAAPFLYFQSEGGQSKLYRYGFANGQAVLKGDEIIPGVLKIRDYLLAFLDDYEETGYSKKEGGKFEEAVHHLLEPHVDECVVGIRHKAVLQIDLVCRLANQVGVIEVKTGEIALRKTGIDQLNTAASREFLGTYIKKILVIDTLWGDKRTNLRDLAEAHQITVIELPGFAQWGESDETEKQIAIQKIRHALGGKARRS